MRRLAGVPVDDEGGAARSGQSRGALVTLFAVLYLVFIVILVAVSIAVRDPSRLPTGEGAKKTAEAAVALGGDGSITAGSSIRIPFDERQYELTGAGFAKQGPLLLFLGTTVARPEGPRAASAFRDKPGAVAVTPMPRLAHVVLRRESVKDGWGKRVGLNAEPQTGDASFDEAIYVEHDGDRIGTKYLLAIPELRARVLELVDNHTSVVINGEGHGVALRWTADAAPQTPMALREAALKLARLAELIPPVRNLELRPRNRFSMEALAQLVASVVGFGALTLAFMLSGRIPVDAGFFRALFTVSVVSVIALGTVAWVKARGRSRGLARFAWTLLAALVLGPLASLSTLVLANSAGITASRREDVAIRAYVQTSKGKQSCYANVRPWRDGLTLLRDTPVACTFAGSVDKPHAGTVVLGSGRLGWEWIERVEVDLPEKADKTLR